MYSEQAPQVATEVECLIHNRVMEGCNHPDCFLEKERSFGRVYEVAVCSVCGKSTPLYGSLYGEQPDPLEQLKRLIPRYFLDIPMINSVLRKLESQGWRWSKQCHNGNFQYSITNGGSQFVGAISSNELEAICSMVKAVAVTLPPRKGA